MANFSKILKDQKKEFASEKKKVQISEAAQEFVLKQQVDKGYTPSALKDKGIGKGAQKIVKDFETAVFEISDASGYADFADFVRQWQTTVAETKNSKRFSAPEQVYIQDVVGEAITQISSLGGVALRSTFAAETFLKQFKPMKLLQMLTQNIPIISEMVDRRIASVEAGETTAKRAVLEGKREEKKERLAGVESKLGGDFGGEATPAQSMATAGTDKFADEIGVQAKTKEGQREKKVKRDELFAEKKPTGEQLTTKMAKSTVGKGTAKGEEKFKEAETEREESQDLFQSIADNTERTVELLEGKKKKGDDGGEGGWMSWLLGANLMKGPIGKMLKFLGITTAWKWISGFIKSPFKMLMTFGRFLIAPFTTLFANALLPVLGGLAAILAVGGGIVLGVGKLQKWMESLGMAKGELSSGYSSPEAAGVDFLSITNKDKLPITKLDQEQKLENEEWERNKHKKTWWQKKMKSWFNLNLGESDETGSAILSPNHPSNIIIIPELTKGTNLIKDSASVAANNSNGNTGNVVLNDNKANVVDAKQISYVLGSGEATINVNEKLAYDYY